MEAECAEMEADYQTQKNTFDLLPNADENVEKLPESVSDCYHTCVRNRNRDLGLAFGRSFRTGWGPCWKFAHFGIAKPHHKKSSTGGLLRPLGLQKHLYTAIKPRDVVPFNINLEQLQSSVYLTPEGLKGKNLQVSFMLCVYLAKSLIFISSHP